VRKPRASAAESGGVSTHSASAPPDSAWSMPRIATWARRPRGRRSVATSSSASPPSMRTASLTESVPSRPASGRDDSSFVQAPRRRSSPGGDRLTGQQSDRGQQAASGSPRISIASRNADGTSADMPDASSVTRSVAARCSNSAGSSGTGGLPASMSAEVGGQPIAKGSVDMSGDVDKRYGARRTDRARCGARRRARPTARRALALGMRPRQPSAPNGVANWPTRLGHAQQKQRRDATAESRTLDRVKLSKSTTQSLGNWSAAAVRPAPRPNGAWCESAQDDNRAVPVGDWIAGQHQYGAIAVRCGGKPDLTALHRTPPQSSAGPHSAIAASERSPSDAGDCSHCSAPSSPPSARDADARLPGAAPFGPPPTATAGVPARTCTGGCSVHVFVAVLVSA